ncbi:hypothetical protein N7454_005417 [Penicillium verhagenii]|nr:hypothetical protein N7454_005417 [Penicillium verhagenii]
MIPYHLSPTSYLRASSFYALSRLLCHLGEPTSDGLPPELKVMILRAMPDVTTMTSIIHASRAYYETYVMDKPEILQRLVKQQYTGFVDLAEALTAI